MQATPANQKLIVISHSHWDRAWYLSFEKFRCRLVTMIDNLLDLLETNPDFKSFTLDGQTILLEDYLAIRPENEQRIQKLVKDGRLEIGPWYVLPDLFLVSGELIIRNFHIGREAENRFGDISKIGYIPDPFGHWAQMPQVLKEFGYEGFIFMRGMPAEEADRLGLYFNWMAPDGTSTKAFYLKDGYFNASALGYSEIIGRYDYANPEFDEAEKQVQESCKKLNRTQKLPVLPLMNGMDHMPSQPEVPQLINKFTRETELNVVHGSLSEYWNALTNSHTPDESYEGDLLGNSDHPILSNVFSTRIYLKKANHSAQYLLQNVVEPLQIIKKYITGGKFDSSILTYTWKTLLKNHPHDNICGCSTDRVHREDEVRFDKVHDLCDSVIAETLEEFYSSAILTNGAESDINETQIFVFNPHPFPVTQRVYTRIFFRSPSGEEEDPPPISELEIHDPNVGVIPVETIKTEAPYLRNNYLEATWGRYYDICFTCTLPGLGYKILTAKPLKPGRQPNPSSVGGKQPVKKKEYEHYRIGSSKQALSLLGSSPAFEIEELLWFEYQQDDGDTYSFGPLKDNKIYRSSLQHVTYKSNTALAATFSLSVPESLENTELTELIINVNLKLQNGQIEFEVEYENILLDGRLRLLLQTGLKAKTNFLTDGHFRLAERYLVPKETPETNPEPYHDDPGELNYTTQHQGDFSILTDSSYNFWIANRGHPEIELLNRNNKSVFATTLHRSVGKLSKGNKRIRRVQAGPSIDTPEAQCLRKMKHKFAVGYEELPIPEIARKARSFSHPFYSTEMPALIDAPKIPKSLQSACLLTISNPEIALSSFHTNNEGEIVVRIFNQSDRIETTEININVPVECYCITDMWEHWNENSSKTLENGKFVIELKAHKIVTLVFK